MTTATTSSPMTFRRIAGYALLALAPLTFAARAAFAQVPPAPDGAPTTQAGDPPDRVARLNYMAGTVTTEPAGATDWSYAAVNRPLTTGDQLWNDANARSELHIGSTAVRLGSSTSLDVMNLDDNDAQLKIAQGTLSTRVREVPSGSTYEIDTPNVALGVTRPGDYRVDVAPDGGTTTVTVRSGALTAYGDNGQVPVQAGQQITFTGTNLQEASVAEAPAPDAFDAWAANRDNAEDRSVSARYVSRDMPGYEDLDANGTWSNDPQYGAIWVPNQEPAGWAPYHDGHWAWIAPWGWTWIDDAPWGFAPYHYGRWAYVRSSWCWVPGPLVVSAPPVYAPALVAFVGGGGGGVSWGVSLAIGGAAAAGLAWFPLGPGEVWHPGYGGWSPHYYQRVNQTVIVNRNVNITNIHNTYINYRAPGAVTAVPATAFVRGQPVAHFAQRVDPRQWKNVRFNPGAAGVAPVSQSFASGLRPAANHPPQALAARSIVATRAPATPAVYRDPLAQHLAQAGGKVPGAGAPVVRPAAPGAFAGRAPQTNAREVRIVATHSPVITPTHGPTNAEQRFGQPGAQPRPEAGAGQPPRAGAEQPHAPAAMEHAPAAMERAQPNNGVPRPPAMNNPAERGAEAGARPAPSWTQPHAPVTEQHLPMNEQRMQPEPRAEQPQAQPRVEQPRPQPQGQAQPHYEQPRQEQARPEPQPRIEQPRPEPQAQPHHEQPRPQPQPQPHYEQPRPQPQPHVEQPRPQPQPHIEQPRPQPQPRPAPAPQQHEQKQEQHAAAAHGDEHHHG
ncbi:DUF6600 domain-containing protein [Trinickia dinghuensis]|uniref:FecR protein n=1 Tax=Trinickia dinghuensis TaxID=2291023 RepID=A0A3D8JVG8_9BURK|nr:DUF6600 domain-containing protein [Trinickia dinghuensis]RDU97133.1 FecR protein [Trinickia dinghuensis]